MSPSQARGAKRRILFVCTGHQNRSPTAHRLFEQMLQEAGKLGGRDFEVRSAGTSPSSDVPITGELVDWASEVYVMEHEHLEELRGRFGAFAARTYVLEVPDEYLRDDPHLVMRLRRALQQHV